VAGFDGDADVSREPPQAGVEAARLGAQGRRELQQDGPELGAEAGGGVHEARDGFRGVVEAFHVGQVAPMCR
jgi:hypothetical protein